MATFAIGDIQGCLSALKSLLKKIKFKSDCDNLWFAGDLVSRGPSSLQTLRFIKALDKNAVTVLGNHDLNLLAIANGVIQPKKKEKLQSLLKAPDLEELIYWLRHQHIIFVSKELNYTLTHAGIYPLWDLATAVACAKELENTLRSDDCNAYLHNMYGDAPTLWSEHLTGWERLRFIANAFTRMRFCDVYGNLCLHIKSDLAGAPKELIPWFSFPERKTKNERILFGHWAALQGRSLVPNIFALDKGYVWGGSLKAMCLETAEVFEIAAS